MEYTFEIANQSQGQAACEALMELAELDRRIVVLSADLKRSTSVWDFERKFPGRFFEMGVAEQNMIGYAAGLAISGMIPFATSFACFAMMRACEQIKVDLAYNRANVKIVATHSGLTSEQSGPTHHSISDLAVARSIPDLTVIVPAGPVEAKKAVKACVEVDGPVFIRLGRKPGPVLFRDDHEFSVGKATIFREGSDLSLITNGRMVEECLEAAESLDADGVQTRVLNVHTLKPLDVDAISETARMSSALLTVEEHSILGGLGSAVAEILAEGEFPGVKFLRLGIADTFCKIGTQEELTSAYGLDSVGIVNAAKKILSS